MSKKAVVQSKVVELTGEVTKVTVTKKSVATVTIEIPAKKAHLVPVEPVVMTIQKAQAEIEFNNEDNGQEDDE